MNNAFEIRKQAAELLKEALTIWRQSDQSDYLEGVENDPVFSLLMTAIAYQSNEIDSEIERLKVETLDEFARIMAPYEVGHATPATLVIQAALNPNASDVETTPGTLFHLASHPFIPLFNSHLFNAKIASVVRIDGRRWKVILEFAHPVKDLSGLSFAINGLSFSDLTLSIGKKALPLIKPWDYSELPFNECFSPLTTFYNRQQTSNFSMLPMDLFAQNNVQMFFVDKIPTSQLPSQETERMELIFEFSGIDEQFPFDKSRLLLNTMVLVNAELHETTLSSRKPFAQIAGYDNTTDTNNISSRQFMHLIQPSEEQLFANTELEVRRMDAERFNQGSLVKLLHCIIHKYHSDFYAFQEMKGMESDKMIYNLQEALQALTRAAEENPHQNAPGVYLLLKNKSLIHNKDFSVSVSYLTTSGAAINGELNKSELQVPSRFDSSLTKILTTPIQGTDEITNKGDIHALLRYYLLTGDRIVTPADIKAFCYKELLTRFNLDSSMIKRISISRRQTNDRRDCGYEILTEITLANHTFVNRNIVPILPAAEILLQKMIEVRSANIYPVRVSIGIEN